MATLLDEPGYLRGTADRVWLHAIDGDHVLTEGEEGSREWLNVDQVEHADDRDRLFIDLCVRLLVDLGPPQDPAHKALDTEWLSHIGPWLDGHQVYARAAFVAWATCMTEARANKGMTLGLRLWRHLEHPDKAAELLATRAELDHRELAS